VLDEDDSPPEPKECNLKSYLGHLTIQNLPEITVQTKDCSY